MKYTLYDPTGNITALIEDGTAEDALEVMRRHPEIEQAGIIRKADADENAVDAVLEMSGGEFCGNASMCAAAWYAGENGLSSGTVRLAVSGAEKPVEVKISAASENSFDACVHMPPVSAVADITLSACDKNGPVPLIECQGISHLIIEEDSPFYFLCEDVETAGQTVKKWCRQLNAPGLGLMFVKKTAEDIMLTPLVYIPGSGTLFWEHSCASGSSAACVYMASGKGLPATVYFKEPGGILKAESDPEGREIWLSGRVDLILEGK